MKFFNKLPTISYNGMPCKNLLARAKLSTSTLKDRTLFYPYTMDETDRVDVLSHKYYDNSDYTWLIFLTNNVIDPYYDLFLKEENFNDFMVSKYGSIANAQLHIAYYRNNWAIDESELTISTYDSLNHNIKKYFNPVTDQYNGVYAYERKKEDWAVTTNRIISMRVSSNTVFEVGSRVQQVSNNIVTANAFVTFSNTSTLTVQHVSGDFNIGGIISGVANTLTVTEVSSNIPVDEAAFWHPVSFYDHEAEQNHAKKEIFLLDNRVKGEAEAQLKRVMSS